MKRKLKLQADRAAHTDKIAAILALSEKENRPFTDEEKATIQASKDGVAAIDRELGEIEAAASIVRSAPSAPERATDAPPVDPTAPPARASAGAPNVEKDPRRGFRNPREFLTAAMANAGLRDRSQVGDERLRPLAVSDKDDKTAAGELAFMVPAAFTPPSLRATAGSDEQGEYDQRYGGFAVPTTRAPGILQVGFEGDPTAGLTQSIPMGSPSVEIMARVDKDHTSSVSGGFTVSRRAETVAASTSRMQLEMITLKASSLFGAAYATEELLTDSPESFAAIIDTGFRTQFGAHMLNEKLRGTGGNQYLGVLTALAASSLGPTISIAKEAGQAADTIVAANVIKARARCWGYGNAVWLANHDTYPQLVTMSIGVGTAGVLVYQEANADRPSMLLGRPIYFTEYASKLGDQGDIGCYNFSQFLEGLYQPLQSAESIHARFLNHERTFKLWLRNAGQPWWRSALTPNKSSDTLSPFVVLDAR